MFRKAIYKLGAALIRISSNHNNNPELDRHEIDGHTFYTISGNKLNLSYVRHGMLQAAIQHYNRRVSLQDLQTAIEMAVDAFNGQKFANAAHIMKTLQQYTDLEINNAVCLEIANAVILLPNEQIEEVKQHHATEKRRLYESSPAVKSFFLLTAIGLLQNMKPNSQNSIADYLEYLNNPIVKRTEKDFSGMVSMIKGN